jgi:hypothetical protein
MANKELFETITFDLLEHFGSRGFDPCNVLIGHSPSQSVIDALDFNEQPNLCNDQMIEKNDQIDMNIYFDLIQRWNTIGVHWRRVEKEISTFFEKIQKQVNFQKGDLVLLKTYNHLIFRR